MKLILVRHGHPNYAENKLTELGHKQAEAASLRLMRENINVVYASDYGRAIETAEHTASKLGLPVTQLEFIHEIGWGLSPDQPREEKALYHPWHAARKLAAASGEGLLDYDYGKFFAWSGTRFEESNERVVKGFDEWLASLGYEREGAYYRCVKKNDDTVALFAHAGSLSSAVAHVLGLPPFYFFGYFPMDFTGITDMRFDGEEGELVVPLIRYYNDHAHITGVDFSAEE